MLKSRRSVQKKVRHQYNLKVKRINKGLLKKRVQMMKNGAKTAFALSVAKSPRSSGTFKTIITA